MTSEEEQYEARICDQVIEAVREFVKERPWQLETARYLKLLEADPLRYITIEHEP